MSGYERDGRGQTAMRHRNSGVRRRGNARRHAGDDLECDAGGGERFRLFAAATKHERIAALESNDALPFAGETDEQCVDVVLPSGFACAAAFADIKEFFRLAV